ncbi:hypothetical protein IFR05_009624 [Cadophora sp. M221]|nr:hypothetical protein IFR05_009624 [Cadophora sp. M221]
MVDVNIVCPAPPPPPLRDYNIHDNLAPATSNNGLFRRIAGLLRLLPRGEGTSRVEVPDIHIPPAHKFQPLQANLEKSGAWIPHSRGGTPGTSRVATPAPVLPASVSALDPAAEPPKVNLSPRAWNLASIPLLSLPFPAQPISTLDFNSNNIIVCAVPDTTYNKPIITSISKTKIVTIMASSTPHNAGLSQSWISPAASNAAKFTRLQTVASHLHLSKSPFFPKTATEYNAHNAAYASDLARKQRRVLEERIRMLEVKKKGEKRGVGSKVEEMKVSSCELAFEFDGERVVGEEEKMREVGWYVAYSGVLGEKTCFWAGGEESLREGKVDEVGGMRAFWPDSSELKVEGETRARKTHQRRFPLPRVDLYSSGMIKHFIPPSANLAPSEKKALIDQIVAKKGADDIAWHERQVVPFKYKLDRLPTLTKLWVQNEKTDNGRPYYTPPTSEREDEGVGGAEEFAVGAGPAAVEEYTAGDGFSSFSSTDGEVFEGSYGYNGTVDRGQASGDGGEVQTGAGGHAWDQGDQVNEGPLWSEPVFGFDGHGHPIPGYRGFGAYGQQHAVGGMPGLYDGRGLPASYSNGADGPGTGKRPPPGGWMFDEDALNQNKDWADLLDELNCAADADSDS